MGFTREQDMAIYQNGFVTAERGKPNMAEQAADALGIWLAAKERIIWQEAQS